MACSTWRLGDREVHGVMRPGGYWEVHHSECCTDALSLISDDVRNRSLGKSECMFCYRDLQEQPPTGEEQ